MTEFGFVVLAALPIIAAYSVAYLEARNEVKRMAKEPQQLELDVE